MTQWVSFADLKRQVSIEDVLVHYGLRDGLRQRRDELVGLCPFHKETRGSFSASLHAGTVRLHRPRAAGYCRDRAL